MSENAAPPATDAAQDLNEQIRALRPARCTPHSLPDGAAPDPQKFWIPEHLAPLHGTAGYERLTAEQRLGYNHHHALHIVEQFIWLEQFFLVTPIAQLLRHDGIPKKHRLLLESLVSDEENHNAAFWRLLRAARPDLYPAPGFRSFSVPAPVARAARLIRRFPRLLSSWLLAANFFEERSILVSREYTRAGERVDSLFSRLYALHAQDEARHCVLDRLLADWLIESQGPAALRLNGWFLQHTLASYHDPRWGFDPPVRALVRDFPELAPQLAGFLQDIARSRDADYQRRLFDASAVPITTRNRSNFAMLDSAIRRFDRKASPEERDGRSAG